MPATPAPPPPQSPSPSPDRAPLEVPTTPATFDAATPVALDAATVRHVAELARLALTEAECEGFAGDLGHVLDAFDSLSRVSVDFASEVDAPWDPRLDEASSRARVDRVGDTLDAKVLLGSAPDADGPYVRVPALLERD